MLYYICSKQFSYFLKEEDLKANQYIFDFGENGKDKRFAVLFIKDILNYSHSMNDGDYMIGIDTNSLSLPFNDVVISDNSKRTMNVLALYKEIGIEQKDAKGKDIIVSCLDADNIPYTNLNIQWSAIKEIIYKCPKNNLCELSDNCGQIFKKTPLIVDYDSKIVLWDNGESCAIKLKITENEIKNV